jgi:hypothetical protein
MMQSKLICAPLMALVIAAGCGGGGNSASSTLPSTNSSSVVVAATSASASEPYTCPSATTSSGTLNCADLPLGDRKYSTTAPKAGYIYACSSLSGSPVVSTAPWLNNTAGTWDMLEKVAVEGSVSWSGSFAATTSGSTLTITGNEVPIAPHTTGTFPISASDPAYAYDRNPNSIERHSVDVALSASPSEASTPTCLGMGAIGITLTGVAIYNAFDAAGYDAVAREEQDSCHGHPDQSDTYHYHGDLQACVPDAGSAKTNSSLLGYALDGFGIYGPWYNGKILTTADLDECHGIASQVEWNGKLVSMYHYVSTYDFPYTLGCYRGKPARAL